MEQPVHAIEVSFDTQADVVVRAAWEALDETGVTSGQRGGEDYRPHLSLSVFARGNLEVVAESVKRALANHPLPTLRLSHVGAFLAPRQVLFCGVTPTVELMICQQAVDAAIRDGGGTPWPIYSPRTWVPHCTLAMDVAGDIDQLRILTSIGLPLDAEPNRTRLVEVPSGLVVADLTEGSES